MTRALTCSIPLRVPTKPLVSWAMAQVSLPARALEPLFLCLPRPLSSHLSNRRYLSKCLQFTTKRANTTPVKPIAMSRVPTLTQATSWEAPCTMDLTQTANTRPSSANCGLKLTNATMETDVASPTGKKSSQWQLSRATKAVLSPKTVEHSTLQSSVHLERDACSDMSIATSNSSIDTSTRHSYGSWSFFYQNQPSLRARQTVVSLWRPSQTRQRAHCPFSRRFTPSLTLNRPLKLRLSNPNTQR